MKTHRIPERFITPIRMRQLEIHSFGTGVSVEARREILMVLTEVPGGGGQEDLPEVSTIFCDILLDRLRGERAGGTAEGV